MTGPVLGELVPALIAAAEEVRGQERVDPRGAVAAILGIGSAGGAARADEDAGAALAGIGGGLSADEAAALLRRAGLIGDGSQPRQDRPGLGESAPLLALVEGLPDAVVRSLLVEVLARTTQP